LARIQPFFPADIPLPQHPLREDLLGFVEPFRVKAQAGLDFG
jgi:hypothetical protein